MSVFGNKIIFSNFDTRLAYFLYIRIYMAHISKTYSKILIILLAWLGFSCETEDGRGLICPEYGVTPATYKAKGTVVSETGNVPIEGIRAVLKTPNWREEGTFWGLDTVYTDNKGVFNLKSSNDYIGKLFVELNDMDGDKNGSFIDKDVEVDYSNVKFTGGNCSYLGKAEKDLGIIKMESKNK